MDKLAKPLVGFSVQDEPPPDRVAVAVPTMPGTEPDTVSNWGVTAEDAADAALAPAELLAVTVKVYDVPLVRPGTTMGLEAPVAVIPLGADVTVKLVIGAPPLKAGAVNDTLARAFPAVATPMVGAPEITALTAKLRDTCGAAR